MDNNSLESNLIFIEVNYGNMLKYIITSELLLADTISTIAITKLNWSK